MKGERDFEHFLEVFAARRLLISSAPHNRHLQLDIEGGHCVERRVELGCRQTIDALDFVHGAQHLHDRVEVAAGVDGGREWGLGPGRSSTGPAQVLTYLLPRLAMPV